MNLITNLAGLQIYLNNQGLPVTGLSYNNIAVTITGANGLSPNQLSAAQAICSAWVDPPQPNIAGFLTACLANLSLSTNAIMAIHIFSKLILPNGYNYIYGDTTIPTLWSKLLTFSTGRSNPLFTSADITIITNYAKTYNIYLTISMLPGLPPVPPP
jgi:hypothetical protein